MGELLFNCFWGLFFLVFIVKSRTIENFGEADPVGPGGFPAIIAILGIALLIAVIAQSVKSLKDKSPQNSAEKSELAALWKNPAVLCVAGLVGYVLLLDILGFAVCTIVLLSVLVFLLGMNSWTKSIIVGLVGTSVFVLMFGRILGVTLPRGLSIVRELSFYLY
jgi:Zn-dependent protease